MLTPEQFRERIEAFLEAHGDVSPTRLGIEAVRDPNFVGDVRNGRVPSLTVAARVLTFIEGYPKSQAGPAATERAA